MMAIINYYNNPSSPKIHHPTPNTYHPIHHHPTFNTHHPTPTTQ
nr:hypothetical protein [uncultured Prevotella sp.]